ncbi:MAG: caspase family protein [Xenococcaceae cyanobacterium]
MADRYALVIGISKYDYLDPLKNVVRDAEAIASVLETYGRYKVDRYPSKWIRAEGHYKVISKSIKAPELYKKFKEFLQNHSSSDIVIYFAGHGLRVPGLDENIPPKGYLAASDTTRIPNNRNAIEFSTLNKLFERSRQEYHLSSLVIIFDCCHAGMAFEQAPERTMYELFGVSDPLFRFAYLAACRGHQEAYEAEEHGLFTEAVLKGLGKDNVDKRGIITFSQLACFVDLELSGKGQESTECTRDGYAIELVKYESSQPSPKRTQNEKINQLMTTLFDLNYKYEDRVLSHFLQINKTKSRFGAFWIRGEEDGGQEWLIYRWLHTKVPIGESPFKKSFKVKKRWTIEEIWKIMSQWLGVKAEPQAIINELYDHWQNQTTVVLALRGVEKLEKQVVEQFMEQLWTPLISRNLQNQSPSNCPFLLFLIDEECSTFPDYEVEFVADYDRTRPSACVKLVLNKFDQETLEEWLNIARNRENLQELLLKSKTLEELTQEVINVNSQLNKSSEDVFERICDLCGIDWLQDIKSQKIKAIF